MSRYYVTMGAAVALYAMAVFLAAIVFEVYIQRWHPSLANARRWGAWLSYTHRTLFVLVLLSVIVVTLTTDDLLLAGVLAAVWFAMSMTLRVFAGLLLRRAR